MSVVDEREQEEQVDSMKKQFERAAIQSGEKRKFEF